MSWLCNKRCFECKFEDCINDDVNLSELRAADKRDRAIVRERKIESGEIKPLSEKRRASKQKYYAKNKEKFRQYNREYYQKRKESIRKA